MIAIGRYFVFMISVTATMSFFENMKDVDLIPFLQRILKLHTEYRSPHGVQKLVLDNNLSDDAEDVLNKINNNQTNLIPKNIGINIGKGKINQISDLSKKEARKLFLEWYDTGAGYNYNKEPSKEISKNAAPFTQIVWKNTKRIGLRMDVKKDGTYIVVVTYSPPGNKKQHYRNNVFLPKPQK